MPADQALRRVVHGTRVQQHRYLPGKTMVEGQRRPPVDDAVAICAPDGVEPGMELGGGDRRVAE